jgi:hypothetical protein
VVLRGRLLVVVAVVNNGRENRRRRLVVAFWFGVGGEGGGEGRSRLEMGALHAPIWWLVFFGGKIPSVSNYSQFHFLLLILVLSSFNMVGFLSLDILFSRLEIFLRE